MVTKRCESRHARQRSLSTVNEMIFEVGNVLLRTLRVKRNAGMGTPAEYLSGLAIKKNGNHQSVMAGGIFV